MFYGSLALCALFVMLVVLRAVALISAAQEAPGARKARVGRELRAAIVAGSDW